jgi:hypothetical protein
MSVHRGIFMFCLFLLILLSSCSHKRRIKEEVRKIEIEDVNIKRYELALFSVDTAQLANQLSALQDNYGPFLNADLSDQNNLNQIREFINDTITRALYKHTTEQYPDLRFLEDDLTLAFKHIRFYFPDWAPPSVYSYVSGLNYEMPVKYDGSDLIIALDMYLGLDYDLYLKAGIPIYQIRRMTRDHILANCIDVIIREDFIPESLPAHMLDKMIEEGQRLYLLDSFLPWVNDEFKIGFSKEQLQWCMQNESNMWAYFIENNLLYSSDHMIVNRFVSDGPFTAAFQRESPARAALWTGWQVVRAFMSNRKDFSTADLVLQQNTAEILRQSGYKPRRRGF